jgi:hypothetical protein
MSENYTEVHRLKNLLTNFILNSFLSRQETARLYQQWWEREMKRPFEMVPKPHCFLGVEIGTAFAAEVKEAAAIRKHLKKGIIELQSKPEVEQEFEKWREKVEGRSLTQAEKDFLKEEEAYHLRCYGKKLTNQQKYLAIVQAESIGHL